MKRFKIWPAFKGASLLRALIVTELETFRLYPRILPFITKEIKKKKKLILVKKIRTLTCVLFSTEIKINPNHKKLLNKKKQNIKRKTWVPL